MSAQGTGRRRTLLAPGITLTPMLDVIFNLIFFFILATTIRDDPFQTSIRLPASKSASAAVSEDPPPSITLDAIGEIQFLGRTMVEEELVLELRHLADKGRREITIHGDERVDYGRVFKVMDLCKRAGLASVLLNSRPASPPNIVKE